MKDLPAIIAAETGIARYIIRAVAHDQLGRISPEKTAFLCVDQTPPTISSLALNLLTSGMNKFISFDAHFDQDTNVGKVDFTLMGSSAKGILDASGILEKAESFVFIALIQKVSHGYADPCPSG